MTEMDAALDSLRAEAVRALSSEDLKRIARAIESELVRRAGVRVLASEGVADLVPEIEGALRSLGMVIEGEEPRVPSLLERAAELLAARDGGKRCKDNSCPTCAWLADYERMRG